MVACALLFTGSVLAQDKKRESKWSIGFTLAPQAVYKFDQSPPKQIVTPLFSVATRLQEKFSITTAYNLFNNSQVLFISYTINNHLSCYGVANKSFSTRSLYTGVGMGTPLNGGKATAFLEYGIDSAKNNLLFLGMFIPFQKKF